MRRRRAPPRSREREAGAQGASCSGRTEPPGRPLRRAPPWDPAPPELTVASGRQLEARLIFADCQQFAQSWALLLLSAACRVVSQGDCVAEGETGRPRAFVRSR